MIAALRHGLAVAAVLVLAAGAAGAAESPSAQDLAVQGMRMLSGGDGVAPDAAGAADLLRQAAAAGSVPACHSLGVMFVKGLGVPADRVQAVAWLRKAADANYAEAQYALGLLAISRDLPPPAQPQDPVAAVKWLALAASYGSPELRVRALARIRLIAQAIGQDRTQDGLEAARLWFFAHS